MWTHFDKKNVFWLGIEQDFSQFLEKLYEAEAGENTGLYLLMMHSDNTADMSVFDETEKQEILDLLSTLTRETRQHHRMLLRVTKLLSDYKKEMIRR